jgi:hypothetical protein
LPCAEKNHDTTAAGALTSQTEIYVQNQFAVSIAGNIMFFPTHELPRQKVCIIKTTISVRSEYVYDSKK